MVFQITVGTHEKVSYLLSFAATALDFLVSIVRERLVNGSANFLVPVVNLSHFNI